MFIVRLPCGGECNFLAGADGLRQRMNAACEFVEPAQNPPRIEKAFSGVSSNF